MTTSAHSSFIYLGYRIGVSLLTREMYLSQKLVKLKHQQFGYPVAHLSSVSTDSSLKENPKLKKRSVLSTNIIHVGEKAVSDSETKVKRFKPSQLHKFENKFVYSDNSTEESDLHEHYEPFQKYENSTYENDDIDTDDKFENIEKLESTDSLSESKQTKKSKGNYKKHAQDLKLFEEFRLQGRNQNFNDTLAAFISVCMNIGNCDQAFQTFKYYLKKEKKKVSKYTKTLTLRSFNEILKGIAIQGDYKKMKEIRRYLKNSSLTPDHNTFAYILTCLGHMNECPIVISEIQSTLQWMEDCNIQVEDIFWSSLLNSDSLLHCLKAVERVKPNFKEVLTCLNMNIERLKQENSYENPLVNELNDSLFSKQAMSPAEGVLNSEEMSSRISNQLSQELKGYITIPSIIKEDSNVSVIKNRDLLEQWENHWRKSLRETVSKQFEFMSGNFLRRDHKGIDFYPFFGVLELDDIVNIMLLEVTKLCMGSDYYSPSLSMLSSALGDEFYNRFLIKYKERTGTLLSLEEIYRKYCTWYLEGSVEGTEFTSYNPRVNWNKLLSEKIEYASLRDFPHYWPISVKASIGKLLYNIIFSSIVIWEENQGPKNSFPAFYKVHRKYDMKIRDEVKPSPLLLEVFRGSAQRMLTFPAGSLPMLTPPVPWTSLNAGGYILSKSDLIRLVQHAHQQKNRIQEAGIKKLFPVLDSLNQLGTIPWKINKFILDILIELFNNKGWAKMDICPPLSELPPPPQTHVDMTPEEVKEVKKAQNEHSKKKKELYSLWCTMLYKLSIANYYRDIVIWLPQNLDFRGRTYPIPPHLTHLSSDVFRSIMLFAQGKKLGKNGIFWLKLHIVNLTGMKKKDSINDRIKFCEEMMEEIFDSADNPLEGRQWWTQSDEPWQTLSACKELVAALRSESPEDFVSHLPIHQDGSCNGLQHYAALGRDKAGATSVNLRPSVTPKDVYSDIVNLVEKQRQMDAEGGLAVAQVLEGFIKRKVIKQTVMTTVYGVTRYGAKLQILKQLNYLDEFPEAYRYPAACYLASKTFQSLGTIFHATKEIQDWFVKIAEGVAKCCLKNVEWVTPLGFPVVQPYSKHLNMNVVPGKVFASFNCDYFLKPNLMKQKNAFPPNFIHSLDSSHMMLTSLFSQHAGITFVSIHDCFWTHASSVPIMNEICREQFVRLHSQPILEDLTAFMTQIYSSHGK